MPAIFGHCFPLSVKKSPYRIYLTRNITIYTTNIRQYIVQNIRSHTFPVHFLTCNQYKNIEINNKRNFLTVTLIQLKDAVRLINVFLYSFRDFYKVFTSYLAVKRFLWLQKIAFLNKYKVHKSGVVRPGVKVCGPDQGL